MFSRNTEKLESFIGSNTSFKGNIKTKGTIRIDGAFEGDVEADWVIVGDKARLTGNASARGIVVGGVVDGNLLAKELIEIRHKGQVKGDISTKKLVVSEGGVLEGRAMMLSGDGPKEIEFSHPGGETQPQGGGL